MPTKTPVGPNEVVRLEVLRLIVLVLVVLVLVRIPVATSPCYILVILRLVIFSI
jgi:hypothetical protein